jgi:hypothetical protein
MWELRILELLIVFFLLLPLIRPFIRTLWAIDGLALLPVLALGIVIGIFPAYGIRPECIPLAIYVVILNFSNIPALVSVLRRLKNDDFRDQGPLVSGTSLGLLIAVSALAFYFTPSAGIDLTVRGVRSAAIRDTNRGVDLYLRIYAPITADGPASLEADTGGPAIAEAALRTSPLMVLVPPAAGSLSAVDRICGELSLRGFTVLTYSRRGIDAPAIRGTGKKQMLSPARTIRLLQAMLRGTRSVAANAIGCGLETERMQDIDYLLSSLSHPGGIGNWLPEGTDRNCIFITGYGAGGAALIRLGGTPEFVGRNPGVRGIIALESPVLSALGQEPPKTLQFTKEEVGGLYFFWAKLAARFDALGPKRISGMGTLPRSDIPVLFILSDRVLYSRDRERRYLSVLEIFRTGPKPVALAVVPGAGPLDYSDVPEKYPLLSLLFPGDQPPVWSREDYAPGTASLISNFAALLTETQGLQRTVLGKDIYIDTNRAWNLPDSTYILGL